MNLPHIDVFLSSWPRTRGRDGTDTFAPVTSTLITGTTEAVLIDAQYLKADLPALVARIEESGKHLTTIYVTHAHADHYFGLAYLLQRFPDARPVTVPTVAEEIRQGHARAVREWDHLFGDAVIPDPDVFPESLDADVIEVDGHPLHLVTIGQADIAPSTVVHIPERNAVVAGDAIYNEVHPMLGLTGPDEWERWLASIDTIAALRPTMIVAGHKKPDADDHAARRMLDTTRRYIEDFRTAALSTADARELVAVMTAAYPDHANPWTLRFSARQWFSRATDNR